VVESLSSEILKPQLLRAEQPGVAGLAGSRGLDKTAPEVPSNIKHGRQEADLLLHRKGY